MLYCFVMHVMKERLNMLWRCSWRHRLLNQMVVFENMCVHLVMCLMEPVDVAFLCLSIWMQFMIASACSICVLSCEINCTVYMIVCKFMVHTVALLIDVSLVGFVYSMCWSFKCA